MLPTSLREVYGMPKHVLDVLRHCIQIALGGSDPFEGLASLLEHLANYANFGIWVSTQGRK